MPLKDYLATGRVNLLTGIRDAGKTRFILPVMIDWQAQGGPPWAYVAADRPKSDAHDTIRDMGYSLSQVPLISSYGRDHKQLPGILKAASELNPKPEILIVEAFQYLADSLNRHRIVHDFMNWVDAYIEPTQEFPQGLTILGLTGTAKRAAKDKYPDPTQRVPGAATWVERASAVLVIEAPDDPELLQPERVLYVCTKAKLRLKLEGSFTPQNRLVFPSL